METSTFSIFSQLLEKRVVTVGHPVDDQVANLVVAQLMHLESEDAGRPVQLYVRSPGGAAGPTVAIRDAMHGIKPDVSTVAVDQVGGTAVLLVAAGAPGARLARAATTFDFFEPAGDRDLKRFRQLLSLHTGQSLKKVGDLLRQRACLSEQEALRLGLVDRVVGG